MKGRFVGMIMFFLVSMLTLGLVSALPNVDEVKINGEIAPASLQIERGEEIDITVRLTAVTDEKDIELVAEILGYEYSRHHPITDKVNIFDLYANNTAFKRLSLSLPENMDKDYYDLRIRIGSRTGPTQEVLSRLHLVGVRHAVSITDVIFSPHHEVVGGRALLSTVRVRNFGQRDQEGLKVTVAIPELGLEASDYINELRSDRSASSEELYIRIPTCVESGIYDVIVTVEYDQRYESVSVKESISIVESEVCVPVKDDEKPKTVVTVPETQNIVKGTPGVVYPITITNLGKTSQTYVVSVSGVDAFGSYRIDPSNVVVVKGEDAKTLFVYVTARDDAQPGEKAFVVRVSANDESKDIGLKAVIEEPSIPPVWGRARQALEIGLVVLVVILIIIGLIIGFSKLRGKEETEEEPGDQTYY